MFIIKGKLISVPTYHCWYASELQSIPYGICYYHEAIYKLNNKFSEYHTLISDITETEESMMARFTKNCRSEIRSAEKNGIITEIYHGQFIPENVINDYVIFYQKFWESKGVTSIKADETKYAILDYIQNNAFCISVAKLSDMTPIVYHTYVCDKHTVRLYHSASQFRTTNSLNQTIIGKANRYLHFSDIKYFKEHGVINYDWGGVGLSPETEGIDRFKRGFGGGEVIYYNWVEAKGVYPKLMLLATKHMLKYLTPVISVYLRYFNK